MNKLEGISCASALFALSVCAQPAAAPKQVSLFSLPEAQLRKLIPETHQEKMAQLTLQSHSSPLEGPPAPAQTPGLPPQFSAYSPGSLHADVVSSGRDGGFDQAIYRRLDEGGYLTRPPVKSDSLLDRGKEAIGTMFTPVPFHIGKTEWSCSVVTAIERQNPLCLLNPIPLNISW